MVRNQLGERQAAILRAVVREYVRSGEPVGSKHLVDRTGFDFSPATVRNEMARLEELGYLVQPHTSAGRVPTDLGYRFVVDELKPRELAEGQRRRLADALAEADTGSIDDLLRNATAAVSRFSHHAAAIFARRIRSGQVRHIELLPVGTRAVMAVAIADSGRVEQRVIATEQPVDEADLDRISGDLNRRLGGVEVDEAIRALDAGTVRDEPDRIIVDGVGEMLGEMLSTDDHVAVGGVANLAGEESFERDTLHRLYDALERQAAVLELLATSLELPVTVRIGSELPSEDLQSCSVVVATFGPSGDAAGSVGIIGPTRMDYERVIATANAVARLLESTFGSASDR